MPEGWTSPCHPFKQVHGTPSKDMGVKQAPQAVVTECFLARRYIITSYTIRDFRS
jgi:hypothetical protein